MKKQIKNALKIRTV